jgi:hypothetical protein
LYVNKTGNDNTAVGNSSLYYNQSGSFNIAIGNNTLYNNVSTERSIAIGYNSLKNIDNTQVAKISGNTAVGYESLMGNDVPSNNTGINNTGIGYRALKNITSGSNNTSLGANSMVNNTLFNNSTSLGANAEVIQSNQIQLGDENIELVSTAGIVSSGKGFLAKGINASQRDAINNPQAGLIIYCIDCGNDGEIQFYNGTIWKNINGNNTTSSIRNSITLKTKYGTDNQFVTLNKQMDVITYSTSSATGATVSGLPNGVSGAWNNNLLTISGTPTQVGTYTYTISLTGGSENVTKSGVIKVGTLDITLTSPNGTDSQTLCIYNSIRNITYVTTGTSTITIIGLPRNVLWSYNNNLLTIYSAARTIFPGNFIYNIKISDGTNFKNLSGTININNLNSANIISGNETQSIILNNPITPISYAISGTSSITVNNLASGLNYSFSNNVITISGTPVEIGLSGYQFVLNGGCPNTINPAATIQVSRSCPYTNMSGRYKVIRDDYGDWVKDDIVNITEGVQPNTLDFGDIFPNTLYGRRINKLIININPLTGSASIDKPVVFGNYGENLDYIIDNLSGKFISCDGQVNIKFDVINKGTNYGTYNFILQKL